MLTMEKKGDESFSEVIMRLTKERGRLSDSLGAWKMSDEKAEQIFSSLRQNWKRRLRDCEPRSQSLEVSRYRLLGIRDPCLRSVTIVHLVNLVESMRSEGLRDSA